MSDYADIIKKTYGEDSSNAKTQVTADSEADPEKAARSVNLSESTGIPAPVIHGDLENFDKQYKARLASEIVSGNPHLTNYVNSNPMAAKVSNDDWHNLDTFSQALGHAARLFQLRDKVAKATATAAYEAMVPRWTESTVVPYAVDVVTPKNRFAGMMLGNTFGLLEMGLNLIGPAPIAGIAQGAHEAFIQATGQENKRNKEFGAEAASAILDPGFWASIQHLMGPIGKVVGAVPMAMSQLNAAQMVAKRAKSAAAFAESGKVPPMGIDPLFDKAHAELAKTEAEQLKGLLKVAEDSTTRERSPEMFKELVKKQYPGDIEISVDAVKRVYGDKVPKPDDGVLGWVPKLEEQLRAEEGAGGYVKVPLADWLTYVDKDLAKELHEDIRVRPNSVTLNEVKANEEHRVAKSIMEPEQVLVKEGEAKPGEVQEPAPKVAPEADPGVEANRQTAALDPLFKRLEGVFSEEDLRLAQFKGSMMADVSTQHSVELKPSTAFSPAEKMVMERLDTLLDRITGGKGKYVPVGDITNSGRGTKPQGLFATYPEAGRSIIYMSLDASYGPYNVLRHEGMHWLKESGFFKPEEWSILEKAAVDKGWLEKYKIEERYKGVSREVMIEEAIAHAYGEWKVGKLVHSPIINKIMAKLGNFLGSVHDMISEVLGKDATHEDIFDLVESGLIGRRGKVSEGGAAKTMSAEPELPQSGTTRMEHRDVFLDAKKWMTAREFEKYKSLLDQRNAEDIKRQLDLGIAKEKKLQTAEWVAKRKEIENQIRDKFETRPDLSADEFFRTGRYGDEKVASSPKLNSELLTEEQRKLWPKDWQAKDGLNPDDVAGMFGYPTGDAMIEKVSSLAKAREESGLHPKAFIERLVKNTAERQLEKELGKLNDNIIDAAKEHVLSQTQFDLLSQEMLALATKAGEELPIDINAVKRKAIEDFKALPIKELTSDRYFQQAGKAGRTTELALLNGKVEEAFKAKQQQFLALTYAKEAEKFEKAQKQFERNTDRFSAREVSGIEHEYTNFIHDLMVKVGLGIKRSVQDLAEGIKASGHKDFDSFVFSKQAELRELPVADFIRDPAFKKPLAELSVEEFGWLNDAIKAMIKNGRDENKIMREGEAMDRAAFNKEAIEIVQTLGPAVGPDISREPSKILKTIKTFAYNSLTMQSIFTRFDRDNRMGLFSRFIMRPLADAANHESAKIRDYQGQLQKAVGKLGDMDKKIHNDFWIDPLTNEAFTMRRRNVLGILQNVGNPENLRKLAEGYKRTPEEVMQWVHANTTKEDWVRAQAIGKIFDKLYDEASQMQQRMSGVTAEKIELTPIKTSHGTYEGWYNPIKYDSDRPGSSKKLMGPNALEDASYYRATTPQGYMKARTGYVAPMELNLDIIPIRMKQMVHDIVFREAVVNASKLFYDNKFQQAVTANYSREAGKMMIPWLKGVANAANFDSEAAAVANHTIEFFRQNTIGTLIGLNPHTVAKHGMTAAINSMSEVGPVHFASAFKSLFGVDKQTGERNWGYAMGKSEELQRRVRNWSEQISGQPDVSLYKKGPRELMLALGTKPVGFFDLMSSVPTWLAEYRKQIEKGSSEGDSVGIANEAVRRAHGSSVITNQAAIMGGNSALARTFSSVYGFFSHMLQKQYETAWKAKDAYKDMFGKGSGDIESAKRHIPDVIMGIVSYVIIPAVVEELVTPYTNSEKDSWGMKAAKGLGMGLSSSTIGVRDMVRPIINARDPQAGMIPTGMKSVSDMARDISKGKNMLDREHAGKLVKDLFILGGVATGLTNAQEGRMAEYMIDVMSGKQKPRTIPDWIHGFTVGKPKASGMTLPELLGVSHSNKKF